MQIQLRDVLTRRQHSAQLQLCVPQVPSGCARCTSAPASSSVSAAQYHPYVASSTTLGCLPARAISRRSSCGLLVILAVPSRLPSSVIRTSTLRRRCRSMPTICRPSYAVSIGGLPFPGGDGCLATSSIRRGAGGSAPSSLHVLRNSVRDPVAEAVGPGSVSHTVSIPPL